MAPWHEIIFFTIGFVGLIYLMKIERGILKVFLLGWIYGVGHFGVSLFWIGNAFLVDASRYGWLAPIAVFCMAMFLGLFSGTAVSLTHIICNRLKSSTAGIVFVLAIIWICAEWVRGWIFTGFPWNLIATIWADVDEMMQIASVFGVYGLGLFTLLLCGLPATFLGREITKHSCFWGSVFLAIGCFLWFFGKERLANSQFDFVDGVTLRLIQANISQEKKWDPKFKLDHVFKQIKLSQTSNKIENQPSHIIWPETAVPFYLSRDEALRKLLAKIIPENGMLITGAPRVEISNSAPSLYWNSLHALGNDGQIKATYDKRHLVPFGEYIPFKKFLSFSKLTEGRVDFSRGLEPRIWNLPGLPPVAPLICYEAIFGTEVQSLKPRPGWMLNVTNDAWFGLSAGPYQHLASVRFRAIEMGMPLIRVANTGISAVIDPYGRIIERLGLGVSGVIDTPLPAKIKQKPLYARAGGLIIFFLFIFVGIIAVFLRKNNEEKNGTQNGIRV